MVAVEALCQTMSCMEDHMGAMPLPTVPEPPPTMEQDPQGVQGREDSNTDPVLFLLKELAGLMAALKCRVDNWP